MTVQTSLFDDVEDSVSSRRIHGLLMLYCTYLRVHALGAVLQLAQLVAALEHELVRAGDLAGGGGGAGAELLQLLVGARDVLRHRSARLQPAALADWKRTE